MFFKKCGKPMTIRNYSVDSRKKKVRNNLAPVLPANVMISGYSGSGKTNLLLNLIYDLLHWDNLYVYAKDLEEPLYENLIQSCQHAYEISPFDYEFLSSLENSKPIDEMDKNSKNLIIFDDFCTDAQSMNKIKEYFIRGRKKNCSCIFISQDYFSVPKIIRLQCSYFLMFKTRDDREIKDIYQTHNSGLTKDEFKKAFKEATSDNYNFLCIDKKQPSSDPRHLRKNFDELLNK